MKAGASLCFARRCTEACRANGSARRQVGLPALQVARAVTMRGAKRLRVDRTPLSEVWRGPESNRRHHDFQSCALPTELPRRGASMVAAPPLRLVYTRRCMRPPARLPAFLPACLRSPASRAAAATERRRPRLVARLPARGHAVRRCGGHRRPRGAVPGPRHALQEVPLRRADKEACSRAWPSGHRREPRERRRAPARQPVRDRLRQRLLISRRLGRERLRRRDPGLGQGQAEDLLEKTQAADQGEQSGARVYQQSGTEFAVDGDTLVFAGSRGC